MSHKLVEKYYYTYIISHTNGKYYVGRRSCKCEPYKDSYMGSGIWVKGIKNKSVLTKTILEMYSSYENLLDAEQDLIDIYFNDEHCMNMSCSSRGTGTGEKSFNFGKNHTEEHKQKISISGKGKIVSEHGKKNMSIAQTGRIITKEHKQKISVAHKGKIITEETKRKMSISHRGKGNLSASILTENIVTQIKISFATGIKSRDLSVKYGVHIDTINDIKYNRTWKHIIM